MLNEKGIEMNKKISSKLRFTMLLLLVLSAPLPAQKATEQEALTVANNWIDLIIRQYHHWAATRKRKWF
jgi:hypothetical protein